MIALRTLRRLRDIWRMKPHVTVGCFAQATAKPKVSVSLHSKGGSVTLYCFMDTVAGNAQAEMYGKTVASITGFPFVDRRSEDGYRSTLIVNADEA